MSDLLTVKLDELFRKLPKNSGLDPRLIEEAKTELNVLKFRAGAHVQTHKQKSWSKSDTQQLQDQIQDKDTEILLLRRQLQDRDPFPPSDERSKSNQVIKIRDNYKRLFEQEWGETYAYFKSEGWNEIEIIVTLQRILRASYSFCRDVAKEQLENIEGEALYPSATWMDDDGIITRLKQREISREIATLAKLYQRTTAHDCLPSLQKTFTDHVLPTFIDPSRYSNKITKQYTKQCVEITWSMCIQDRPLTFLDKLDRGADFDTEKFRKYTTTGRDKFDYLVWPAMLLHQGGPLVAKGLVQPIRVTPEVGNEVISDASEILPQRTPLSPTRYSRMSRNDEDVIYIEGHRGTAQTPPKVYKRAQSRDDNVVPSSPFFAPHTNRTPDSQRIPTPELANPVPAIRVSSRDERRSRQGRSTAEYHPDHGNLTVAWKNKRDERIPSAP